MKKTISKTYSFLTDAGNQLVITFPLTSTDNSLEIPRAQLRTLFSIKVITGDTVTHEGALFLTLTKPQLKKKFEELSVPEPDLLSQLVISVMNSRKVKPLIKRLELPTHSRE